ncbi:MAG TPA: hypothetical protein VIR63_02030 [Pontiella sp.]
MEGSAHFFAALVLMLGCMFTCLYLIMRKDSKHFHKVVEDLGDIKNSIASKVETELDRIERKLDDLKQQLDEK